MLHIRATLRNPNDTTTNGVSNYTKSYTVDMLKNHHEVYCLRLRVKERSRNLLILPIIYSVAMALLFSDLHKYRPCIEPLVFCSKL